MTQKFRALRLVALLYKVGAWVVFVVGGLVALFVLIIGAIQGQAGVQSPLVASVPLLQYVSGPLSGFIIGILILLCVLLQFVLLYAASEVIYLGLAIEHNTRETAYYLRGENEIPPPPPAPVSWDTQTEPPDDKA
jgi:hypothetical protein